MLELSWIRISNDLKKFLTKNESTIFKSNLMEYIISTKFIIIFFTFIGKYMLKVLTD